MKMKKNITIYLIILFFPIMVLSQETTKYIESFYSTRVINGHSSELVPAGRLDFKIGHRMGRVNRLETFWGLDQATSRIGLEYGVNRWLMVGAGRNTSQKMVDGFIKFKIFRQSTGARNFPFTISWLSTYAINTLVWTDPVKKDYLTSRMFYTNQFIVARKFGKNFSLQLMPTHVHKNFVELYADENDIYSLGIGSALKVSRRISLVGEYFYIFPGQIESQFFGMDVVNCFSLGVDIFTGKHTFQIHITNATTMIEKGFITETTERWDKGQIHIGFNMVRLFTIHNN